MLLGEIFKTAKDQLMNVDIDDIIGLKSIAPKTKKTKTS